MFSMYAIVFREYFLKYVSFIRYYMGYPAIRRGDKFDKSIGQINFEL